VRPPELSAGELVGLATERRLSMLFGAARDAPCVIVSLDDEPIGCETIERTELGTMPCVLIGVGRLDQAAAALVDVVATGPAEAEALADAVARRPVASTGLALLLRHGAARSVGAGLVAESTTYSMLQGSEEFRTWRAERPPRSITPDRHAPVTVSRVDGTTRITLDRPHRHNAVSTALSEALVDALTNELGGSGRIVLCGNGPSFCSGGDLDEFGAFPDPAVAHAARLSRSAGHLVHLLADRLEARVHGACIGAGIEIPAFAHRVVAAPDTVISLPELGLGLVPGAGGTVSLPRRIGRHRTASLVLSGGAIDAPTALEWGLVDEISSSS
jgi:hypothetical protein